MSLRARVRPRLEVRTGNDRDPLDAHRNRQAPTDLDHARGIVSGVGTQSVVDVHGLDVEVRLPPGAKTATLKGYVVYGVCDDEDGACRFLRTACLLRRNEL